MTMLKLRAGEEPAYMASRAVLRRIEAGVSATCALCDAPIRFRARHRGHQVIANVYEGDNWARVEHWCVACYISADQPYGGLDGLEHLAQYRDKSEKT